MEPQHDEDFQIRIDFDSQWEATKNTLLLCIKLTCCLIAILLMVCLVGGLN